MPDWKLIRDEYENGASLRSLASKYGISKSVIGKRKYEEKWTERTDRRTDSHNQPVINRDSNAGVRAAIALKLRTKRLTYQEIADQAGYASAGAARNAIQRELERTIVAEVQQMREEELAMLDKLHASLWDKATDEKNQYQTFAAERVLQISDRRAKLMGLDTKPDDRPANLVVVREVPVGLLGIEEPKA